MQLLYVYPTAVSYGPGDSGATNGSATGTVASTEGVYPGGTAIVKMTNSSPLGNWFWGVTWTGFTMPTLPSGTIIQGIYGVMVIAHSGGQADAQGYFGTLGTFTMVEPWNPAFGGDGTMVGPDGAVVSATQYTTDNLGTDPNIVNNAKPFIRLFQSGSISTMNDIASVSEVYYKIEYGFPGRLVTIGHGVNCNQYDNGGYFAANFPPGNGTLLGDTTAMNNYCRANGIHIALTQDSQRSCADLLTELFKIGNTAPVYSGNRLKMIPLDEVSAAGNGAIYVAPTASGPVADLTDIDFVHAKDEAPVKHKRDRKTNCDNVVSVEYIDRTIDYMHNAVSAPDACSIALYGTRKGGSLDSSAAGVGIPTGAQQMTAIHDPTVAAAVASIMVKVSAQDLNIYNFDLKAERSYLEAMDLVTITDTNLGLIKQPVRFRTVKENEDKTLACEVEDFIYGLHHPDILTVMKATGSLVSTNIDPGLVNTPVIFEPTQGMLGTGANGQIWFVVSGGDINYGGCVIYVSIDGGISYTILGTCSPGTTGYLTANLPPGSDPDTTNTIAVDLSESLGSLSPQTQAVADAFLDQCYIDTPTAYVYESLCPTKATLTSQYNYTMGTYIRRGVYSTDNSNHATGRRFAALGAAYKVDCDPKWIGQQLYFKFAAFNLQRGQQNALPECVPYTYTPVGVTAEQLFLINGGTSTGGATAGQPTLGSVVTLASLTAPNTSASSAYNHATIPANFTGTSYITTGGITAMVNTAIADDSMNPATPLHISNVDVHSLFPAHPSKLVMVHMCNWWGRSGHITNGTNSHTATWANAVIADFKNRGVDGFICDWYGQGTYEDQSLLLLQTAAHGSGLKFMVCVDQGMFANAGSLSNQAYFVQQLNYCKSQYFSDPNYCTISSVPLVSFFDLQSVSGLDYVAAKSSVGTAIKFIGEGTSQLSVSGIDGCMDWVHVYTSGASSSDPYNLAAIQSFCTAASSASLVMVTMCPGFNGTLTEYNGSWSKGKFIPRGWTSGALDYTTGECFVQQAGTLDTYMPSGTQIIQIATWNDYEEGSEVETGIINGIAVSASVSSGVLSWTISGGTGTAETIDHYEVYASSDSVNATLVAINVTTSMSANISSLNLLSGVSYTLYVVAVGKPMIVSPISNGVSVTI